MKIQATSKHISLVLIPALLAGMLTLAYADEDAQSRHAVFTYPTASPVQRVQYSGPEGWGQERMGPHRGEGKFCESNAWQEGLTADQRKAINQAQLSFSKDTSEVIGKLRIAKAELDLASSKDPADLSTINAKIDEISKLQNQVMKRKALYRQEVRKLLTEEQRMSYDADQHHGPGGWHGGGLGDRV